jgi:fused signal recognition particle receptor
MARSFLGKLKRGLFMTHTEFLEKAGEALRRTGPVEPVMLDRLEEALIAADAGVELSVRLVDELRAAVRARRLTTSEELRPAVRRRLLEVLEAADDAAREQPNTARPRVTLLVGVNGTGKTTTAAKLAKRRQEEGRTVILAAADTFRAAAVDQLKIWAERVGTPVIHQQEGADPAAVVFDAIDAARSRDIDEVLVDTAGRLHNRSNLMKELEKVSRIAGREVAGAPHEVLLVLDATTGSNGIEQAQRFGAVAGVTGVVLTKLDGTAKGGVVLAIADRLKLPVRWVGVGESEDDLLPFSAEGFVDSLLDMEPTDTGAPARAHAEGPEGGLM